LRAFEGPPPIVRPTGDARGLLTHHSASDLASMVPLGEKRRRMIRRNFFVFVAGTLCAFACAVEDSSKDKYPTLDSFCDAKAGAECSAVGAVCGVSDTTCKSARVNACKGTAASAGGRTYKPSSAESCVL